MNELVNYISYITHKILSAIIIIGIADNLKIIIVIGDKKSWTDNANLSLNLAKLAFLWVMTLTVTHL